MKKLIVLFGLFIMVFTLSAFKGKTATPFKNLQVLPDSTTEEQLDAIMHAYNESLNVKCRHCHIKGNMASDENPEKEIARKMMRMTNEINEKYFGKDSGTVGCMTCHNGKLHP